MICSKVFSAYADDFSDLLILANISLAFFLFASGADELITLCKWFINSVVAGVSIDLFATTGIDTFDLVGASL